MRTVLVVVEARGLLAHVALGNRVRIVAAHFDEPASILAAELNLNTAVALAEDASGRLPLRHVFSRHSRLLDKLKNGSHALCMSPVM
jgi:hypothetical protein